MKSLVFPAKIDRLHDMLEFIEEPARCLGFDEKKLLGAFKFVGSWCCDSRQSFGRRSRTFQQRALSGDGQPDLYGYLR